MLDCRVMTVVRNGGDYLGPSLEVLVPYVRKIQIIVDSRSNDNTIEVIEELERKYSNISHSVFPVSNPAKDLVDLRNQFFPFEEKWGFIVDSDEYHFEIEKYRLPEEPRSLSFQCWAPWTETRAHRSSSRAIIGRLFPNSPGLIWRGAFGKEVLYDCGEPVFRDTALVPYRYIHFTHLKKDSWRSEMGQERIADGKYLSLMPEKVISVIKQIHEKVPNVRFREVGSRP